MIPEVTQTAKPDWLYTDKFEFDVHKVLKDSLYYPSSGIDGKPIKFFMDNVYCYEITTQISFSIRSLGSMDGEWGCLKKLTALDEFMESV